MKIKLETAEQVVWKYHFFGWGQAIKTLSSLHNNYGIKFIGYLDEIASSQEIKEPFIGFFHHTPYSPNNKHYEKLKGLNFYFNSKIWEKNKKYCKGIFTLCNYTKKFIEKNFNIHVDNLWFPMPNNNVNLFCWEKYYKNKTKIIFNPGNWLRDLNFYNKLKTSKIKTITKNWKKISPYFEDPNESIECLGYLNYENYDKLISSNIVFQCYFDVAASNTILECIAKNTPIIVNRLPAAEEYLGKDYPLFYNNSEEASTLCDDEDMIYAGHVYLKNMNKKIFTSEYFLNSFISSKIYKNIKNILLL